MNGQDSCMGHAIPSELPEQEGESNQRSLADC